MVTVVSSPAAAPGAAAVGVAAAPDAGVATGRAPVALAVGTPTCDAGSAPAGAALTAAAGRGEAENIDGWPVCLFHPSHSRTSDMVKTTQSRVRRMSVMGDGAR